MRIFLDTHDLIRLFEKYSVINRLKIKEFFLGKKHVLVYSLNTILEISDPLNFPHQSRVMKTLNEMEDFPHIFVSESEISTLELLELINSYNKQEEFNKNNINPFRRRFDSVVAPYGGYTHLFLKYDLGSVVFDLWSVGALKGIDIFIFFASTFNSNKRNIFFINFY